jgi:hypothetical protein
MSHTQQHTTLGAAKSALAARLGDPTKTFFTDLELAFALAEARRMWNAASGHDRTFATFSTIGGESFYWLDTALPALRDRTLTVSQLVTEIQYHLMETPAFSTDQFTLAQIRTAVERRRSQFIGDTACVVTRHTVIVPGGSSGLVPLPNNAVGVRRASFSDVGGRHVTLRHSDERYALAYSESWRTHGQPRSYTTSAQSQRHLQLIPPPAVGGVVELLLVTTVDGDTLGVPDDVAWGVKYGALADLLLDQSSLDPLRAQSCQDMYDAAVQLALAMPVVLTAELDGRPTIPAALSYTDTSSDGWRGLSYGSPRVLSIAAPDLVVLSRTPDSRPHSVGLHLVRNAPVPASDVAFLDIPREHLDALLGMAQRICTFKCAGVEYVATEPLSAAFLDQTQKNSIRRAVSSTALQTMLRTSQLEQTVNPWERTPRSVTDDGSEEVRLERNARRRGPKPFRKR